MSDENVENNEAVEPEVAVEQESVVEPEAVEQEFNKDDWVSKKDHNSTYFKYKQAERDQVAAVKERDELQAKLDAMAPAVAAPAPDALVAPTLEGHDFDQTAFDSAKTAYDSAYIEKTVATQVAAANSAFKEQQDALNAKALADQAGAAFNVKAVAYAANNADYNDAIGKNGATMKIAPHVHDAIMSSDVGPALDHLLLANPEINDKLNSMTPVRLLTRPPKQLVNNLLRFQQEVVVVLRPLTIHCTTRIRQWKNFTQVITRRIDDKTPHTNNMWRLN